MPTMTSRFSTSMRLGIGSVLLSLLVAATAFAQTAGTIEGSVVDANGNPLPGVVVTVTVPACARNR